MKVQHEPVGHEMHHHREHHRPSAKPTSLSEYFENMARAVFLGGFSGNVVDAKWAGIREAFYDFDVGKVAALTPDDVDSLSHDTRLIRNHQKIEAIVDNAGRMLELDREPGGFAGYLKSHRDFDEKVATLKHDFSFMGNTTAVFFLWLSHEPVPERAWTKPR